MQSRICNHIFSTVQRVRTFSSIYQNKGIKSRKIMTWESKWSIRRETLALSGNQEPRWENDQIHQSLNIFSQTERRWTLLRERVCTWRKSEHLLTWFVYKQQLPSCRNWTIFGSMGEGTWLGRGFGRPVRDKHWWINPTTTEGSQQISPTTEKWRSETTYIIEK